jgi:hypothetical protein
MAATDGVSTGHVPMINWASRRPQRPIAVHRSKRSPPEGRRAPKARDMALPPSYSAASARAAGISRGVLRGTRYVRLAHDLTVRLDDAIDRYER